MTRAAFIFIHMVSLWQPITFKTQTMSKIYVIGYTLHRVNPSTGAVSSNGFNYGVSVRKWIDRYDYNKFVRRVRRLHREKNLELNFIKKEKSF